MSLQCEEINCLKSFHISCMRDQNMEFGIHKKKSYVLCKKHFKSFEDDKDSFQIKDEI